MRMDRRIGLAALDVERYSKQGTADLQVGHIDKALDAFKYAYKRSRDVDDGYTERACAFNLGAAYIAANQAKRGLDVLQQAVPPDNKKEGRSNGDLYFNFGLGFENLGNLEEAVRYYMKSYEEYKSERDNLQMEAESLEKLGNLQVKTDNVFAEDSYGKLAEVYGLMNKPVKQLESLCQKANQQHKHKKSTECEATADECLRLTEQCGSVTQVGNALNDLGLIYTQMQKYDRAISCFEQALPLVRGKSGDKKQEAVILQNLGATYNFVGDYQRAVGFHESASSLYAELKNRNSQGQCFANLAFALSQLGDKEGAGEAFLHAHQAAKDTGDTRTQWQVLEGLGAVAFNNGNLPRAIDCFKRALAVITASESNTTVQDRIVGKLTNALQEQIIRKSGGISKRDVPFKTEQRHLTMANILPNRSSKEADRMSEQPIQKETAVPSQSENPPEKPRYVPVNRPGSRREFQKVARGLSSLGGSMTMDGSETLRPGTLIASSSSDSSTSSSSSSSSSSEEDGQDEKRKAKVQVEVKRDEKLRPSSKYGSLIASKRLDQKPSTIQRKSLLSTTSEKTSSSDSSSSSEDEEEKEDEEDHNAVKAEMKKQLSQIKESSSSSSSEEEEEKKPEEKHVHGLGTVDEGSKESSSSSSSSSSSDEEESPPLPTSSPFPSGKVNTYEDPHLKYGQIDFKNKYKGEVATAPSKGDHPNYLSGQSDLSKEDDDDDESDDEFDFTNSGKYENIEKLRTNEGSVIAPNHTDTVPKDEKRAAAAARAAGNWENDHREIDPTYQSIDFRTQRGGFTDTPSAENNGDHKHVSDLPRGESRADQEIYLHNEHMKLVDKRQTAEDNEPQKAKDSKTCVVM
ncbi:uncharacterized protein LOC117334243 isoform X4 [Pecten maximus]|uniref:uncharacterized protein LOC117334243 isoform X4 n=1 Tax=Pecten maximus TaxID=6579 RepID=UPI001458C0B9|nr:uncharacterized protein LOC117334243 isoform X4 [Pecten maximus]